jgi:hypothetical protein
MKKIKLIYSILFITFLSSCEDRLNEFEPYNAQTLDTFYKTPADFTQAVNGMYSGFRTNGYYAANGTGSDYNILADILSDNLILNTEGRQSGRQNAEFNYNSNSTPTALYSGAYFIISRSNAILKNIDNLSNGAFKNDVRGQALAIRAICHFDVARSYSKIPTQSSDANSSIGIAYSTDFDPEAKPSRLSTVSETYSKIISDLETASSLISTTQTVGKLDKRAVLGLLSRVYLYQGNYELAATRAQECIAAGATLATRAQFTNIWKDAVVVGDPDMLFKVLITSQDNLQLATNYFQFLGGAYFSEYVCDYGLFQLYNNSDIRKSAYIRTATTNGVSYNHIIKYDVNIGNTRFIHGKYLRTSEVYLNLAEALMRKSSPDPVGALSALDNIRSRRYQPFTSGGETGTNLLNSIMLERRLELAFESDRFYTLKRLGQNLQRSGFGHLSNGTGNIANPQTIPSNDYRWQFPISRNTILFNPNIIQNPNY